MASNDKNNTLTGKPSNPVPSANQPKPTVKLTAEEIAAEKVARFKKVASGRASAITKNLLLLGNCSVKTNYTYTKEQVSKMFEAIEKALTSAKRKFEDADKETAKEDTKVSL